MKRTNIPAVILVLATALLLVAAVHAMQDTGDTENPPSQQTSTYDSFLPLFSLENKLGEPLPHYTMVKDGDAHIINVYPTAPAQGEIQVGAIIPDVRITLHDANLLNTTAKIDSSLGTQGSKTTLSTKIVSLAGIDASSAVIRIKKEAGVTNIFRCDNFDQDAFSCPQWTATEIAFTDDGSYIEFSITQFSAYAGGEIKATNADHLASDYTFISDIFADVKETDGTWSEPIYQDEIVRVTFERNLTDGRVIDVVVRSNRTMAYFDVYEAGTTHLVGRSGITEYPELQYIIVRNLTRPTDVFDFKVVKVVQDREDDSTNIDPAVRSFLEFDFIHDDIINSTQADGLVAYQELNVQTPRYRTWNETNNFTAELVDAQTVGADINWIVVKASHERDEIIMGTEDQTNDVSIQIFNSSDVWTNLLEVSTDVPNAAFRAFDIEYEDLSGDALIVYETSSVADTTVAYRLWNGTDYSAEQTTPTGLASAPINWISLTKRTGTNEIMLLMHDDSSSLHAVPWNGTSFEVTKSITLSTATTSATEEHFAFAWEESSGEGFAAYGSGNNFVYRTYSPTAPHWSTEATIALGNGLDATRLCSDPASNHIGIIMQDAGNDVNVRMWDGALLLASPPTQDAGTELNGANNANIDCAWVNSSTALFGFVDRNALSMDYFTFEKANTWSTADLTATDNTGDFATDDIAGLRFTKHPTTNETMVIAMDVAEDISAILWNGTGITPVTESPIEASTEVVNGAQEGVMFDWYRYDPIPNVTALVVSNSTAVVNETIHFNSTVTDNIQISLVFANVTLPNGSIDQITMGNDEADIYNGTFDNTALVGTYTIRIIANDTSVHQNVNSSLTITFTVGDVVIPNVTVILPASGANFNQSDNVTIRANVTDDINVSVVFANVTLPNGTIDQITLAEKSNNITYEINFTDTANVGTYTVRIVANDTSNNINSSGTTTFTIGDTTIPTVINLTPAAGTNFAANAAVNITANVTDSINVSAVQANITLPNGSVEQLTLLDNNSDSVYNGTFTTTSASGTYNVTIIANDTSNNINSTETTYFTVGDVIIPTIILNTPADDFNTSDSTVTFNFTVIDNADTTLNCSLLLDGIVNQTNASTPNATPTLFIVTGLSDASRSWNITCTDSSANSNTSGSRPFRVDTGSPDFNNLTTAPTSASDLDPGVLVNITANVTDNFTNVDTVILQRKLSTEADSEYVNVTMTFNTTTNLYNASFNVTQNGTYNLRLHANDTVDNRGVSNLVSITIELERTWTRTPSTFSPVTAALNTNATIGNLTINNTGDYSLDFNITSDSSDTAFNDSSAFTLAAGGARTLNISDNATETGVKTVTLNISVNDSDADPTSLTTTGTIVVAPGQPVLSATFTTPSGDTLSTTQGAANVEFTVRLENIGEGDASNITFFMDIPSNWTITFGQANVSIDQLNTGESEENTILVTIPSDFTPGSNDVTVNATGVNGSGIDIGSLNLTFGDTVNVTVASTAPLGPGGGDEGGDSGGGTAAASAAPSGRGGGKGKPVSKIFGEETIYTQEIVSIVRGTSQTIPVRITNPYRNADLTNIHLELDGFLAQYVTISPLSIAIIQSLKSEEFFLTLTVPSYFKESTYSLTAKIVADLVALDPDTAGFVKRRITEIRTVILNVETIADEEISIELGEAQQHIQDIKERGFNAEKLEELLTRAEQAIEERNYKKAREIFDQLSQQRRDAFATTEIIQNVQENIAKADEKWIQTPQTADALQLALLAFERGDFGTSLERAKNAQLIYVLETKGKINLFKFVLDWWWALLLGTMFLSVSGFFTYKKSVILIIDQRLKNLNKEEENLQELLEEAQKKYLCQGEFSIQQYKRYSKQYEQRITKIRQLRITLRNKRISILRTDQELQNIAKEKQEVQALLKQNQLDYLVKGKMGRRKFMDRYEQNKARVTEIELEEAVLEEKLEKEKETRTYAILSFADKVMRRIEGRTNKPGWGRKAIKKKYQEEEYQNKEKKHIARAQKELKGEENKGHAEHRKTKPAFKSTPTPPQFSSKKPFRKNKDASIGKQSGKQSKQSMLNKLKKAHRMEEYPSANPDLGTARKNRFRSPSSSTTHKPSPPSSQSFPRQKEMPRRKDKDAQTKKQARPSEKRKKAERLSKEKLKQWFPGAFK